MRRERKEYIMNEKDYLSGEEFEFMTEEEKEALEDEFLSHLGELIEEDESKSYVLNIERCREMTAAYNILKSISKNSDTKVSIKLNEPYPSMGSMTVCGKNVEFFDSEEFMSVALAANNLDAYPLTNGNVKVTFTFHGLTKKIKGV